MGWFFHNGLVNGERKAMLLFPHRPLNYQTIKLLSNSNSPSPMNCAGCRGERLSTLWSTPQTIQRFFKMNPQSKSSVYFCSAKDIYLYTVPQAHHCSWLLFIEPKVTSPPNINFSYRIIAFHVKSELENSIPHNLALMETKHMRN